MRESTLKDLKKCLENDYCIDCFLDSCPSPYYLDFEHVLRVLRLDDE